MRASREHGIIRGIKYEDDHDEADGGSKENEAQKMNQQSIFFIFSYILYAIRYYIVRAHTRSHNVCIITIYTYVICTTMTVKADMNPVKSS